jgi:hypothetical protein
MPANEEKKFEMAGRKLRQVRLRLNGIDFEIRDKMNSAPHFPEICDHWRSFAVGSSKPAVPTKEA